MPAAAAPPAVFCTRALDAQLQAAGTSATQFATLFQAWQVAGEYSSPYFGKDGAYYGVKIDNRDYLLRHVHLEPKQNTVQKAAWWKAWGRRARKKSDTALVYTKDSRGRFLLIWILAEPDAHDYINRTEAKHIQAVNQYAKVAAAFLADGSIIG